MKYKIFTDINKMQQSIPKGIDPHHVIDDRLINDNIASLIDSDYVLNYLNDFDTFQKR